MRMPAPQMDVVRLPDAQILPLLATTTLPARLMCATLPAGVFSQQ